MNRGEPLSFLNVPETTAVTTHFRKQSTEREKPFQKGRGLSSTRSDSDWVSPFTLPPLPALRRGPGQHSRSRSPEHSRQRDGSGIYYAAAWGSPYASPSPELVPQRRLARRSIDSELSSPPEVGILGGRRQRRVVRHSIDGGDVVSPERRGEVAGKERVRKPSEKPNWLSDSGESSSTDPSEGEEESTPTRKRKLTGTGPSSALSQIRRVLRHQNTESVDTVTPDSFRTLPSARKRFVARNFDSLNRAMAAEEQSEAFDQTTPVDLKPLPGLPILHSQGQDSTSKMESSMSPTRPSLGSMQSFQRPKKKVVWKSKNCYIALPLTDRVSAGLPPLLSTQELKEKLEQFKARGYNTRGFELTDEAAHLSGSGSGQSRLPFPDPIDVQLERKMRQFTVHVPDQAEWNAWVQCLQEEKLRALGVTPSSSEPSASVTSPFSSQSRTSSRYPGSAFSPPAVSSSVGSNPLRVTSDPFSPALSASSGFVSPEHGYKQSTTQHQQRQAISPSGNISPYLGAYGSGAWSPTDGAARRPPPYSPINPQGMQSLGEVLSPGLDNASEHRKQQAVTPADESVTASRPVLQPRASSHEPRSASLSPPPLPQQSSSLPRTPNVDQLSRPPIEIQHPTPRSHRHNLSEALQREIDDAEAALERLDDRGQQVARHSSDENRIYEQAEYEVQDEPPILKRPETLGGSDDRSDIETNPSIAASPLLMNDKSPMSMPNWQALSDAAKGDAKSSMPSLPSHKSHKAQPSLNKFNVEAKEFDPQAGFSSKNFTFGNGSFQPFASKPQPPMALVRKDSTFRQVSAARLNVEAPTFVPGGAPKSITPEVSSLKFASTSFNVEAPEFNPTRSQTKNFKIMEDTEPNEPKTTIFGDVTIQPNSKVTRRATKILPIIRPRDKKGSSSGSASSESEAEEDDAGRPTAPSDRNKRARTIDSDGDQSPVFAASAPFANLRFVDEEAIKELVDDEPEHKMTEKPTDGWSYIPADEASLGRHEPSPSSRESDREEHAPGSPSTFRDDREALKFSEAHPQSPSLGLLGANSSASRPPQELSDREQAFEPLADLSVSSRKEKEKGLDQPQSVLSALAEPFVLSPKPQHDSGRDAAASPSAPADVAPFPLPQPPRKSAGLKSSRDASAGLQSSRWARTPTSPAEVEVSSLGRSLTPQASLPPASTARLSSPISHRVTYVKNEDGSKLESQKISQDVEDVSSLSEEIEVRVEEESETEAADDHRSVDARSIADQDSPPEDLLNPTKLNLTDDGEDLMPSFEEIDAVMRQFENNPELGVERNDSPLQSTPLVDMRLSANLRSDAPSPSPRRPLPQHGVASTAGYGLGIGIHKLNTGKEEVSDWGDAISAAGEEKIHSRAHFFDGHVNALVDGVLENRLVPLERTLQTIQHSISLIATRPGGRRSLSTDPKESDADDEDGYDAHEGFASYRSRSPDAKRNRRTSRIRAAVTEGLAAYKDAMPPQQPTMDFGPIMAELAELRLAVQKTPQADSLSHPDLVATLEDVISSHPRLRGSRVQQDHDAGGNKHKLHIDGLEAMLKAEQERAAHESRLRRKADEEIELLKLQVRQSEDDAAEHKEASEEAQKSLTAFVQEKDAYRKLEQDYEDIMLKNNALDKTLAEYRRSRDEWEDTIDNEREKNRMLSNTLDDVRGQLQERSQGARNLRTKVDRLQHQITGAMQDLNSEQSAWRQREHELMTKMSIIENALDQATRQREKAEVDYNIISRQHKEALLYKDRFETIQQEMTKTHELVANLSHDSRTHEGRASRFEHDLRQAQDSREAEMATATAVLRAELEGAKFKLESFHTDSQAQISRLQSRVDSAELDLEEERAKHNTSMVETIESHRQVLHETTEKHEATLEERNAAHDRKLADLRDRHTRALHNSSDDRHRLEYQYNEKLSLSDDKIKHLEGKLIDIEERLEITKSAARAAVEAATAKGINLPTPASSVVASPPQRISSASMPLARGSEVPEKIPVQSLRETIMVLQEQLQNRESKIEELVAEIKSLDKNAPQKLKERETEVSWLRELLAVRVDDLEDVVATLAQPEFNRESVKDAAIRLRANIQMEQQIREKAASVAGLPGSFPSIATLSTYAQSPRVALPMVATAAWGNFQRARNYGSSALSELTQNYNQTPSKSTASSPGSFMSGIMTPPNTTSRTPVAGESMAPPAMRPLAAAALARKAQGGPEPRSLRAFNSQPRVFNSRQPPRVETGEVSNAKRSSSPHTPTLIKRQSFSHDVDDDASPLDGKENATFEVVEPTAEE